MTYDHPTSQLKQSSEAELYAIIENGTDAEMRGAARAELELRSYQRGRRVADRQQRIAWMAVWVSCISALVAVIQLVIRFLPEK